MAPLAKLPAGSAGKNHRLTGAQPAVALFLGPIQSNKTRAVAEHFSWVHSLARLASPSASTPRAHRTWAIKCMYSGQCRRRGEQKRCTAADVAALAEQLQGLAQLKLRGLMAIPNPANPAPAFNAIAQVQAQLSRDYGWQLDTLSMGMSDDLDLAIAAGSTLVRVGTAIFGPAITLIEEAVWPLSVLSARATWPACRQGLIQRAHRQIRSS